MDDHDHSAADAHPGGQADTSDLAGLTIRRRPVIAGLYGLTVFFIVADLAVIYAREATGHLNIYGLLPMFDMNDEANLPTAFSAALLAFATWILFTISSIEAAAGRPRLIRYWRILALLFGYMAIDEMAGIHELPERPLREFFDFSGALYYAWVVPAIPAVAVFAVAYSRFLLVLPRRTAIRFVTAGAFFVGGAIGVEMIGAPWAEVYGDLHTIPALIAVCEEAMEMVGVVLFIDAMLRYLKTSGARSEIRLRFG